MYARRDNSLLEFLKPDETAQQLLARTFVEPMRTGVTFIDSYVSLRPGHILELWGPSGAGKTETLMQSAVTCILPKEHGGVSYQGQEGTVFYFDLDGKFDSCRLLEMLEIRVTEARSRQRLPSYGAHRWEFSEVVDSCLSRFKLIKCTSSFQLLASLKLIHKTIKDTQDQSTPRLLILDNISAHYWIDKASRATPLPSRYMDATLEHVTAPLNFQDVHSRVAEALQQILSTYRLCALVSKGAVGGEGSTGQGGEQAGAEAAGGPPWGGQGGPPDHGAPPGMLPVGRDFMPSTWRQAVTYRLLLHPMPPASDHLPTEPKFVAQWEVPHMEDNHVFIITDTGTQIM